MPSTLDTVTELLEALFIPLVLLELVVLGRARKLGRPCLKEMLANVGTYAIYLAAGVVGLAIWIPTFDAVASLTPLQIPITWWSVAAAVLVADFIYYWEHRVSHRCRVLWDLYHSVHHSSERFDQTTSLRLGAFDALLALAFSLPMVAVGISPGLTLAATALVLGYQTWIHTELIDKMPAWFESTFNTPSHHRAHHGAEAPYLDTNYGGILIVWDRLFGTFQPEIHTPEYGLTTQIKSSNPLRVQFAQLACLFHDTRSDPSWRTRLARLWHPPGWQPHESGESVPVR